MRPWRWRQRAQRQPAHPPDQSRLDDRRTPRRRPPHGVPTGGGDPPRPVAPPSPRRPGRGRLPPNERRKASKTTAATAAAATLRLDSGRHPLGPAVPHLWHTVSEKGGGGGGNGEGGTLTRSCVPAGGPRHRPPWESRLPPVGAASAATPRQPRAAARRPRGVARRGAALMRPIPATSPGGAGEPSGGRVVASVPGAGSSPHEAAARRPRRWRPGSVGPSAGMQVGARRARPARHALLSRGSDSGGGERPWRRRIERTNLRVREPRRSFPPAPANSSGAALGRCGGAHAHAPCTLPLVRTAGGRADHAASAAPPALRRTTVAVRDGGAAGGCAGRPAVSVNRGGPTAVFLLLAARGRTHRRGGGGAMDAAVASPPRPAPARRLCQCCRRPGGRPWSRRRSAWPSSPLRVGGSVGSGSGGGGCGCRRWLASRRSALPPRWPGGGRGSSWGQGLRDQTRWMRRLATGAGSARREHQATDGNERTRVCEGWQASAKRAAQEGS